MYFLLKAPACSATSVVACFSVGLVEQGSCAHRVRPKRDLQVFVGAVCKLIATRTLPTRRTHAVEVLALEVVHELFLCEEATIIPGLSTSR